MDTVSLIACVFSILGKILVNRKSKWNFVFFLMGYIAWISWNVTTSPNVPMIFMYTVYSMLSIYGWIKWNKEESMGKKNMGCNLGCCVYKDHRELNCDLCPHYVNMVREDERETNTEENPNETD